MNLAHALTTLAVMASSSHAYSNLRGDYQGRELSAEQISAWQSSDCDNDWCFNNGSDYECVSYYKGETLIGYNCLYNSGELDTANKQCNGPNDFSAKYEDTTKDFYKCY